MASERLRLNCDKVTVLNHALHALTGGRTSRHWCRIPPDRQAIHNLMAVLVREDPVVLASDDAERLYHRQRLLRDAD